MVDYRQQLEELEYLLREACEVAGIEFHEAKFAPADLLDRIVALEADLAACDRARRDGRMSNVSADDRIGWMQLRVAEKERRQRGGGMTVRVEDMRYLLDRMAELERERDSEATKAEDWFRRHNDVEADLAACDRVMEVRG